VLAFHSLNVTPLTFPEYPALQATGNMAQIFQAVKPMLQLTLLHLEKIQLIELQESKNTPMSQQ
jgi:hypothetical protein